ncbi:MAG: tetratricopeptide repeat protein [Acidobacteriota bacterium]
MSPNGREETVIRTLLMSDLVNSTQLVEMLGDQRFSELGRQHDRVARDLLQPYEGLEIDKTDGFLLLFERPLNAVLYALAYHRDLGQLAKEQGVVLASRVGIHLGEVVLHENAPRDIVRGAKPIEVEGLAKPLAARLMSLAGCRQTLVTRAAFDLARRGAVDVDDADDLCWLSHGNYQLKGVAEPLEVFEVGRKGQAPLTPPADSSKAWRSSEQPKVTGWRPAPGVGVPQRPTWRVQEKLGEGGFGEVWLAMHPKTRDLRAFKFCYEAHRLQGLKREITLFRLLKGELGERDDIARILDWSFDHEPYFIESEYTTGGALPDWLATQRHDVSQAVKLRLVAQVATALAAAHSVGVLHKDVKPSNVLIQQRGDGSVQAQISDFGVGRLLERQRLVDAGITLAGLTEPSEASSGSYVSGTPLYMAPELLEGQTATLQADIYALGVLLYQLLVGDFRRPLAPGWRRDIKDDLLAEDIACFVDRSPARRPQSAQEVAERLRKLEERRAVREAAEQARLALERLQHRRKLLVSIAAVAVFVLALVSGFAIWALKARQQETQARHDEVMARQTAEDTLQFLVELFEVSDPNADTARGQALTAREILERGAIKLEDEYERGPLTRARLMDTLGQIYLNLHQPEAAVPLIREAWVLREHLFGAEHPEVDRTSRNLLHALTRAKEYEQAKPLLNERIIRARQTPGTDSLELASLLNALGTLHFQNGEHEKAERLFRESLSIHHRTSSLDEPSALNNLASIVQRGGDHGAASSLNRLASVLEAKGDLAAAELAYCESLQITRESSLHESTTAAGYFSDFASLMSVRGSHGEAKELISKALSIFEQQTLADPSIIKEAESIYGSILGQEGQFPKAESLLLSSYEVISETTGAHSRNTQAALERLIDLYQAWGRLSQDRE